MINHELQVYTHDLNYQPYTTENQYNLPGDDGDASEPMAFSTHNNVIEVAQFIELLDNKRIINKYISTVKCTKDGSSREWRNACWIPPKAQVVYGQRMVDNLLISYGESLEIVAHEIFHGITAKTARLESRNESGALNESYSDILAVIIFNHHRPNIADWIWEIGRPFGEAKQPIRSLQTPSQYKQPEHYNNYPSPQTERTAI
jgi:Zn-dependent metalloprotease